MNLTTLKHKVVPRRGARVMSFSPNDVLYGTIIDVRENPDCMIVKWDNHLATDFVSVETIGKWIDIIEDK